MCACRVSRCRVGSAAALAADAWSNFASAAVARQPSRLRRPLARVSPRASSIRRPPVLRCVSRHRLRASPSTLCRPGMHEGRRRSHERLSIAVATSFRSSGLESVGGMAIVLHGGNTARDKWGKSRNKGIWLAICQGRDGSLPSSRWAGYGKDASNSHAMSCLNHRIHGPSRRPLICSRGSGGSGV
jgi:hypothetical protein